MGSGIDGRKIVREARLSSSPTCSELRSHLSFTYLTDLLENLIVYRGRRCPPVGSDAELGEKMRSVNVVMLLVVGLTACSSDTVLSPPTAARVSLARSPDAGCGRGFDRKSISELMDLGVPRNYLLRVDANGNGFLCSRPLPDTISPLSPEFGHFEIIDDRGPA